MYFPMNTSLRYRLVTFLYESLNLFYQGLQQVYLFPYRNEVMLFVLQNVTVTY